MPKNLRPDQAKVIFVEGGNCITAHVDPKTPGAWKKKSVFSHITKLVLGGEAVLVSHDTGPHKVIVYAEEGKVRCNAVEMFGPDENGTQWMDIGDDIQLS